MIPALIIASDWEDIAFVNALISIVLLMLGLAITLVSIPKIGMIGWAIYTALMGA